MNQSETDVKEKVWYEEQIESRDEKIMDLREQIKILEAEIDGLKYEANK